jgi:hypothetical protein
MHVPGSETVPRGKRFAPIKAILTEELLYYSEERTFGSVTGMYALNYFHRVEHLGKGVGEKEAACRLGELSLVRF